jgi:hypothetical protein
MPWPASKPNWLAPALAALRSGELDCLRLLAPGERGSVEFVIRAATCGSSGASRAAGGRLRREGVAA